MNRIAKVILLLLAVSSLFGCAQKIESISQDVDKKLDNNSGYLLIGIDTNTSLHSLFIGGTKFLKFTGKDLRYGSNYILVSIPEGKYHIKDVKFDKRVYISFTDDNWDFEVKANQVNYVGDFYIEAKANGYTYGSISAQVLIENRSTAALLFLEDKFPSILASRKVRYSGTGRDNFLQYAETLPQAKEGLR